MMTDYTGLHLTKRTETETYITSTFRELGKNKEEKKKDLYKGETNCRNRTIAYQA